MWALAGAVCGGLAVVVVANLLDVVVQVLLSPYAILLLLSGLFAAVLVAVLARLWRRRLDPRAIVAASGVLTFVLFWALPLYLAIQDRHMASGPLFG